MRCNMPKRLSWMSRALLGGDEVRDQKIRLFTRAKTVGDELSVQSIVNAAIVDGTSCQWISRASLLLIEAKVLNLARLELRS